MPQLGRFSARLADPVQSYGPISGWQFTLGRLRKQSRADDYDGDSAPGLGIEYEDSSGAIMCRLVICDMAWSGLSNASHPR